MIVRMIPAIKDYLWGGTKLRTNYGKEETGEVLAESWEFSVHPDGPSKVLDGQGREQRFASYLQFLNDPIGGGYQTFPLLTKLLDAKEPLSIQVHPTDQAAPQFGEPRGKTEMWHILEAEPGAFLYLGLKETITKEELAQAIEQDRVPALLNQVFVEPGENYLVPAGTIHAIGAGITLLEVQEDSNLTFRVSDYGRTDAQGNRRPLHIKEALSVASTQAFTIPSPEERRRPVKSNYFSHDVLQVAGAQELALPGDRFLGVVVTEGNVTLADAGSSWEGKKGDSFFIEKGAHPVKVDGKGTLFTFTCDNRPAGKQDQGREATIHEKMRREKTFRDPIGDKKVAPWDSNPQGFAGMICTLLSVVMTAFAPIALLLWGAGLVLSVMGLKQEPKWPAYVGLALSIIQLVLGLLSIAGMVAFFSLMRGF